MARMIVNSIRDQFDKWFRQNVSKEVPTQEEVQKARQEMLDAQKRYDTLSSLRSGYQTGLKALQEIREPKPKPEEPMELEL